MAVSAGAVPVIAAPPSVEPAGEGATAVGAEPPLVSAAALTVGATNDPPSSDPSGTTLVGVTTVDLLGGPGRLGVSAPDTGTADTGSPKGESPFEMPPPSFDRRPATIPVPAAVHLFAPGAALALYAGRRMRARSRRRGR